MTNIEVALGEVRIANNRPFVLIAGPCQIESLDHSLMMADELSKICARHNRQLIYKSSFDKANRTSIHARRGVGMEEGLKILARIQTEFECPVLTDVHEASQCQVVASVADVLQIPAFLCRQTDLLLAAGQTGKAVNVKKGQFLAPWDMAQVAAKITSTGNTKVMLCERGTSFGYNTLVSDFRALEIMAQTGHPVVFDGTHSVQQPGAKGSSSGGERKYVPLLARAAVAVGCAALFVECHQDPENAPSDGANMLTPKALDQLLATLGAIEEARLCFDKTCH